VACFLRFYILDSDILLGVETECLNDCHCNPHVLRLAKLLRRSQLKEENTVEMFLAFSSKMKEYRCGWTGLIQLSKERLAGQ
jgi:hypothetical protein